MLKPSEKAPEFNLPDQDGGNVSLASLLQHGELVLYFYPADFSPVCTAEACLFRDNYEGVAELGIQIVGVSPQSVQSHKRFAQQFNLPFPLLSDAGKKVIRAYGADGFLGIGVRRVTFRIGRDGVIKKRVVADLSASSHLELLKSSI